MLKVISLCFVFLASPCLAEVFFYGERHQTVELRSDQPSLLKFPAPPLSSSCQPAALQFEPLVEGTLAVAEKEHVEANTAGEGDKDLTIRQLVRVTPLEKAGSVTCSFALSGGAEVPVRFSLSENVARPFIEFRPRAEKLKDAPVNSELETMRSLIKGEPIQLQEVTKDFEVCSPASSSEATARTCRLLGHSSANASYELKYAGTGTEVAAWSFSVTLTKDIPFAKLADLKVKGLGSILLSAVSPQKATYKRGDTVTHYVVTDPKITISELMEVLP